MGVKVTPDIAVVVGALKGVPEAVTKESNARFGQLVVEIQTDARKEANDRRPRRRNAKGQFSKAPQNYGTQHWRDLVASIKTGATETGVPFVAFGDARLKWEIGHEFGSRGGPRKAQFPPWRKTGYFFFPTVDRLTKDLEDEMTTVANKAMREAFPE